MPHDDELLYGGKLVKILWDEVDHNIRALEGIPLTVKRIIETKAYLKREYDGKIWENSSLAEFITCSPLKGCGWPLDKVERLIKDDPEVLAMWRDALTAPVGVHRKDSDDSDNVTIRNDGRGNSKAYTASRLMHERPDLFDRVIKKELSVNKAAIEAGFRRQSFTVSDDPRGALRSIISDLVLMS
jgi:hypothetical protein